MITTANTLQARFCQASLHLDKIGETRAKPGPAAGTLTATLKRHANIENITHTRTFNC